MLPAGGNGWTQRGAAARRQPCWPRLQQRRPQPQLHWACAGRASPVLLRDLPKGVLRGERRWVFKRVSGVIGFVMVLKN